MDDFTEQVFRRELEYQLQLVITAEEGLVSKWNSDARVLTWYDIEAALGALIRVANLLWPSSKKLTAQDRASTFRALLSAPDEATPNLRTVRNGFEHFDERLDDWSARKHGPIFADRNFGQVERLVGQADPSDVGRT